MSKGLGSKRFLGRQEWYSFILWYISFRVLRRPTLIPTVAVEVCIPTRNKSVAPSPVSLPAFYCLFYEAWPFWLEEDKILG